MCTFSYNLQCVSVYKQYYILYVCGLINTSSSYVVYNIVMCSLLELIGFIHPNLYIPQYETIMRL